MPTTDTRKVISTTTVCDGDQHDARIITDGATSHAYLLDGTNDQEGDLPTGCLLSEGHSVTTLQIACNALDVVTGDTCRGYFELHLAGPDAGWDDDPEARAALDQYGHEVER